jgi:hypothetical protein
MKSILVLSCLALASSASGFAAPTLVELPRQIECTGIDGASESLVVETGAVRSVVPADELKSHAETLFSNHENTSDNAWSVSAQGGALILSWYNCDEDGAITLDLSSITRPAGSQAKMQVSATYVYHLRVDETRTQVNCKAVF